MSLSSKITVCEEVVMEGYAIAPASHGENKIEMDQDRKHGINSSSPSTMGSAPCEASNLVWALIPL